MLAGAALPGQETVGPRLDDAPPTAVLEDVEVTARRGAARVPPEQEYDGAAIDALAAWDINEVIARASERAGDRDPPVIIINGQRVADPSIYLDLPPDAMTRLELLPPQAASLYGQPPGRRVMNLVMERRFDSTAMQVGGSRPTAGGTSTLQGDLRRSSMNDGAVTNFGGAAGSTSSLRAGERSGYTLGQPGDESGSTTLRPETRNLSVNAAVSRRFGDWSSSLRLDARSMSSRSVAVFAGVPTGNRTESDGLSANAGLNGAILGWQTQAMLNGGLNRSEQYGLSDSRQQTRSLGADLSADRSLKSLPAGDLRANLSVGLNHSWSEVERASLGATPNDEDRISRNAQFRGGLTLPLFSRTDRNGERRPGPGDLSLSLAGNLFSSESGGGQGVDLDLNWSPLQSLRFNTGLSTGTSALPTDQLYAPLTYGDPITVFDLVTGESVQVVPIRGGNPDLRAQSNDRLNIGVSAGPYTGQRLFMNLNYMRNETRDGPGQLDAPTPALEAAFPDRFIRDADGRLISIDQRPLNLASSTSDMVSASLNADLPLPWSAGEDAQRLRINLNHSYQISDISRFGPGAPVLDRLSGVGAGRSRQTSYLNADTMRGRWSLNATGQWQSGYRLRRNDEPGPNDLEVDAVATVNLRIAFVLMPRQRSDATASATPGSGKGRMSGGGQLTLQINNLFDTRPDARLGDGRAAPGYGRDDRDPLGRSIQIQLAKRF
jgi:hypothetical protein